MFKTREVDPFLARFRGNFTSLMTWPQLADFWNRVHERAGAGWYIYAIGEPAPTEPRAAADVLKFVDRVDILLRADHDEDYCAIVYTDSKTEPTFIKIFDPHNLGVSCGYSTDPPLPGWIMCLVPPQAFKVKRPLPENRRRWWQQLWIS